MTLITNKIDYKKLSIFLDNVKPFGLIHLGKTNPNYLEIKKKKGPPAGRSLQRGGSRVPMEHVIYSLNLLNFR